MEAVNTPIPNQIFFSYIFVGFYPINGHFISAHADDTADTYLPVSCSLVRRVWSCHTFVLHAQSDTYHVRTSRLTIGVETLRQISFQQTLHSHLDFVGFVQVKCRSPHYSMDSLRRCSLQLSYPPTLLSLPNTAWLPRPRTSQSSPLRVFIRSPSVSHAILPLFSSHAKAFFARASTL